MSEGRSFELQAKRMGAGRGAPRIITLAILVIYLLGLCSDIARPWTGLHDWNGAFFSQLARNLNRYPVEIHHGLPMVAVGAQTPPPEERSIYARHPPALVWMLAGIFRIFGESEWAARLLPILSSLGSLLLFMRIADVAYEETKARLAGLIFAILPMTVYFGRMVNHEPLCLCFMLVSVAFLEPDSSPGPRMNWLLRAAGFLAVMAGIWTDWAGALFAWLYSGYLVLACRRRPGTMRFAVSVCLCTLVSTTLLLSYLVYAGIDGRWSDLVAIFLSRTAPSGGPRYAGGIADHVLSNLTWPVLVLVCVGLVDRVSARLLAVKAAHSGTGKPETAGGLWVVHLTGLIWVGLFWRQFQIHHYWMFYLAPFVALTAADGIIALTRNMGAQSKIRERGAIALLLSLCAIFCVHGTWKYTSIVSCSPQLIEAWREISRASRPDQRILISSQHVAVETHGGCTFRNIVPPQFGFYLDRPFQPRVSADQYSAMKRINCLFVTDRLGFCGGLESHKIGLLCQRLPHRVIGPLLVFGLDETP